MITYYKLFDMLNRRHMTVEELRTAIGASSSTMSKMRQNKIVSLDVIARICDTLDCQPGEIMENEKENL
ncbi:helix-turn-helix transcriptional regulator [Mediterraneibacter sp. NSJ-55]|uniref:Helix-turn-helix transcriptional regulator n=1 Tax=Mediterraneibacter hominis TaxID=2763054 RepID=A0A923LG95_9FIRM|nr:helix-turn-helix transcriptional regulator [Mediterraneibacter hominis]MBC5688183.1 helix-turn-helix transcriptional regulator [Mediterraneibacter hominis]